MSVSSGIQASHMAGPERNDLSERIAKAQAERASRDAEKARREADMDGSVSAGAQALRYGAEFGASVFVGIMFGLVIDHFFGTKPWGLLAMLGFGLAAGILNVIRAYRQLTAAGNTDATGPDDGPENDGTKG
ncbi:AtpZ/AtpI family protein [Henriciella aquimarina]|uniref:AtpZ/AtpI family protein n=1 Tax=Henriciella aquimarina TaxID=545261 RepID=UPI001301DDBC|nr:AtpZ/AtpI family protein [Henriciella aquimarina]